MKDGYSANLTYMS